MTTDTLPNVVTTTEQLDELLSRPSAHLIASMKTLDGDIMILGAGGKVGPTIARMAKRAIDAAGVRKRVVAVDLFPMPALEAMGIETITCDMMDLDAVAALPKVENVVYMIGRKFGSTGQEHLTWATNVIVPYHVARAFTTSRIAAFSTGCVYPLVHVSTGGCTEDVPADPVGEYAQSCLGRERMFDYFAAEQGEKVVHIRLNYAVELRYGVLYDIASRVWAGEPVDITTGYANVIWQGDCSNQVLQSFALASAPAAILNITGPEIISIQETAETFARLMGKSVTFTGETNGIGYLNNSARATALFGAPAVSVPQVIEWIAAWIMRGGESLGKATHFETQNGKY
ncbi:MAG TPA: NAD-dependent epimerase/dehydratase family protein [Armatimonadota bacterium]|nr:NAD-dependent epimerase/dehydratase family protein [Armatimonadota bacterium]